MSKELKCPKCKGTDLQIQFVETGSKTKKSGNGLGGHLHNTVRAGAALSTLGMSNLFIKKAKGNEKSKVKNEKVCICQKCGHSWEIK